MKSHAAMVHTRAYSVQPRLQASRSATPSILSAARDGLSSSDRMRCGESTLYAPLRPKTTTTAGESFYSRSIGGSNRRVLVVDDDAGQRLVVKTMLLREGFEVRACTDHIQNKKVYNA